MNEAKVTRFLATEIMGWDDEIIEGKRTLISYEDSIPFFAPYEDFKPLTDIAHAFMVVEKFIGHSWSFDIVSQSEWKDDQRSSNYKASFFYFIWNADIDINTNRQGVSSWEASPPSKAISIAAVRALANDEQIQEMGL